MNSAGKDPDPGTYVTTANQTASVVLGVKASQILLLFDYSIEGWGFA